MVRRISKFWNYPEEDLRKIVKESKTFVEILRKLGLQSAGGQTVTIKKILKEKNIDWSHIPSGFGCLIGRNFVQRTNITNEEIFTENSVYARQYAKSRIIKQSLIEYKCQKCGLVNEWKGEKLVLILDHINGVANDHRLNNLRFLCPNCNSQTPTFAGRKHKGLHPINTYVHPKVKCKECDNFIFKSAANKTGLCRECWDKSSNKFVNFNVKRKVKERPTKELVEKLGYSEVGRQYGVSCNAVKKWFKGQELDFSKREYEKTGPLKEETKKKLSEIRKSKGIRGSLVKSSKLNEEQVREIKLRLKNGDKQKNICKDYGIARNTISAIKNGWIWEHIEI